MLNIINTPNEEYVVFKENMYTKHPQMMVVPQQHPSSIYVSTKEEMPMTTKMFVGGLSIVGLYFVYKFLDGSLKK